MALIPSRLLRQVMANFLQELNSKGLYQSSGKEKESCCLQLVFPSSTKRKFRHFHVVVVQRRQRNVQKSVMLVQSCCLLNYRSRCCRASIKPGTRNIPEYAGTFRKIPEHEKIKIIAQNAEGPQKGFSNLAFPPIFSS